MTAAGNNPVVTVDRRFRGPTTSGNGGYVAGMLADLTSQGQPTGDAPVTVTLRKPPPLGLPLDVIPTDDGRTLMHESTVIAEATLAPDVRLATVAPTDTRTARAASATYPGLTAHPFPECFVCGPRRSVGDGLRLFPGRLGDGRTACVWDVRPDVTAARFVWAALDCPGGWAAPIEGRPMVLGRMTAAVDDVPKAGESCVAMGFFVETVGRKTWTRSTVFGADGRVLGRAEAVWIALAS